MEMPLALARDLDTLLYFMQPRSASASAFASGVPILSAKFIRSIWFMPDENSFALLRALDTTV